MKIFETKLRLYIICDIEKNKSLEYVSKLIDKSFLANDELRDFHYQKSVKNYCFNNLYPIETEKYQAGKIYTIVLRTADEKLAQHFNKFLKKERTDCIQALDCDTRAGEQVKIIEQIHSITPCVCKFDCGYWKNKYNISDFEKRVKENAIKKYRELSGEDISFDGDFIKNIKFLNKIPIATNYKNIKILGDKVVIEFDTNANAQKLAQAIFAGGLLEMNARGFGFVNAKFI